MIEQKSIAELFIRYSDALEVHERYRQPENTVVMPLVIDGNFAITKYFFSHLGMFVASVFVFYFAALASVATGFPAILHWFPKPHDFLSAFISNGIAYFIGFTLSFLSIPISQFVLLFFNIFLASRKEAFLSLRGPTHISLSPLSIKLLWKGAICSSIGAMFGWSEITCADIDIPVEDPLAVPSVVLTAQVGRIIHAVPIRLDGFSSDEDRIVFLNSVNNHLPDEKKTPIFKQYLSDVENVRLLLVKVKEHSVEGLLGQDRSSLAMDRIEYSQAVSDGQVTLTDSVREKDQIAKPKMMG